MTVTAGPEGLVPTSGTASYIVVLFLQPSDRATVLPVPFASRSSDCFRRSKPNRVLRFADVGDTSCVPSPFDPPPGARTRGVVRIRRTRRVELESRPVQRRVAAQCFARASGAASEDRDSGANVVSPQAAQPFRLPIGWMSPFRTSSAAYTAPQSTHAATSRVPVASPVITVDS